MVGAASGRGDDAARAGAGIGRQPFLEQWHRGDIALRIDAAQLARAVIHVEIGLEIVIAGLGRDRIAVGPAVIEKVAVFALRRAGARGEIFVDIGQRRSEEHTSELQSLMRISYAVFCLKKKKKERNNKKNR